jgi:uridine kinase
MRKRRLHLVSGPSGSGKSWLCSRYTNCHIITTDNFYIGRSKMKPESNGDFNFDAPEALDLKLCRKIIETLICSEPGSKIDFPEYDMTISERKKEPLTKIVPAYDSIIILEGIFSFHVFSKAETNDPVDLRLWLDVKPEILLGRRFKRDIEERARTPKSVLEQYNSVLSGYHKYIEPKKIEADILLPLGTLI